MISEDNMDYNRCKREIRKERGEEEGQREWTNVGLS